MIQNEFGEIKAKTKDYGKPCTGECVNEDGLLVMGQRIQGIVGGKV